MTARNLAEGGLPAWIDPAHLGPLNEAIGMFASRLAMCARSDRPAILGDLVSTITEIHLKASFDRIEEPQHAMDFNDTAQNAKMWIVLHSARAAKGRNDKRLIRAFVDASITSWIGKAWNRVKSAPDEGAGDHLYGQDGEAVPGWSVRLREARKIARLSRPRLVQRMKSNGFEITADAIKKHEEGKAKPRVKVREAYAAIYKTTVSALFS